MTQTTGAKSFTVAKVEYNTTSTTWTGMRDFLCAVAVSGGDRNVYRLTFGGAAQDQLSSFREPPGFSAELRGNLARLRQQVLDAPADRNTPRRPFHVMMGAGTTTSAQVPDRLQAHETHRAAYPYPNVVFYVGQTLIEQGRYEDPAGLSPAMNWGAAVVPAEEMLETAAASEEHGYTHVLNVAHGTDAFWTLPTLEQYLERTPTSCIAMAISELNSNISDSVTAVASAADSSCEGRLSFCWTASETRTTRIPPSRQKIAILSHHGTTGSSATITCHGIPPKMATTSPTTKANEPI